MPKYIILKPIGIDGVSYMPGTTDKPTIVNVDVKAYGDTLDGHVKEGYLKPVKEDAAKDDKPKVAKVDEPTVDPKANDPEVPTVTSPVETADAPKA